MREFDLAEQVEAQQREQYDPQGEIDLAVEDAPVVGLVGHVDELQREGQLHEGEHHLEGVHPAAGLRHFLQHIGEEREECERYGDTQGEAQHTDDGFQEGAAGGVEGYRARDGQRAGEGDQHEGQRHEEDAGHAACVLTLGGTVDPRTRQGDLEIAQQREGEDEEDDREEDVRDPVGAQHVAEVRAED